MLRLLPAAEPFNSKLSGGEPVLGLAVFTSVGPADGVPRVFQTSASGGVTTLQKTGLIAPDGVTVASGGDV